ncbi:hypothetical protein EMCRGX_G019686 [Ephydatia muelleri]
MSDTVWKPIAYASRTLTETEQCYAQIEKEALAITWACEKFSGYLLRKQFSVETDHKPLVPLLSTKMLDSLPPRVLRFRLRLMRFQFTIHHMPGKNMYIADALSRAPTASSDPKQAALQEDVEHYMYVTEVVAALPGSAERINVYRSTRLLDPVTSAVIKYCSDGWPEKHKLPPAVKGYWGTREELIMNAGLLLFGKRTVVPQALQAEMLAKLHQGHQGIERCRLRATEAVWWPGISVQIENMIKRCPECVKRSQPRKEPMIMTKCPDSPWQKVAADLFQLKTATYLAVVDYFSHFVEVAKLGTTTSNQVIQTLKGIFLRHGIPKVLVSDNGPQFSSQEMRTFAEEYGLQQSLAAPITRKSCRTSNGSQIADNGTTDPGMVYARVAVFKKKNRAYKEKQKEIYDRIGERSQGQVVASANAPRSYVVETPTGEVRRNNSHLVPQVDGSPQNADNEAGHAFSDHSNQSTSKGHANHSTEQAPRVRSTIATRLRTGTKIQPPERYQESSQKGEL